jgi:glutamyl/glutaminyl-tRNA synthetase
VLDAASLPERKSTREAAQKHLSFAESALSKLTDFSAESVRSALWDYATKEGRGAVLWPIRYALSGRSKTPDPFVIAGIIGKSETIQRIARAKELL